MFAQDLSNDIPTILVRSDIRSIEYHKYSLFIIRFPDKSGLVFTMSIVSIFEYGTQANSQKINMDRTNVFVVLLSY